MGSRKTRMIRTIHMRARAPSVGVRVTLLRSSGGRSSSSGYVMTRGRAESVDLAGAVAEVRPLVRVRRLVGGRVVGAGRRPLPEHVGCHARPDDRRAVLRPLPDRMRPVRVEAVTECAAETVGEEAVLALPPRPVARVEAVHVEVASEG